MIEFEKLLSPPSLARIRKIASSIWPETFRSILSPEQISYMMEMMYAPDVMKKELENGYSFTILKIHGEDAGYVVTSPSPEEEKVLLLHKLYLLSCHHGKNIGGTMLAYVEKTAKEMGCRKISLHVNRKNLRAIKCYTRNGYTVEKELCTPIGRGFFMDDYIMVKIPEN